MRDKQRPWLDFDGSLELARQEKAAREAKGKIRYPRNKYMVLLLLLVYGVFGAHRFYLYDAKMGWKFFKFGFLLLSFMHLVIFFTFGENIWASIVQLLIMLSVTIKEYPYIMKTVDQINKDISS